MSYLCKIFFPITLSIFSFHISRFGYCSIHRDSVIKYTQSNRTDASDFDPLICPNPPFNTKYASSVSHLLPNETDFEFCDHSGKIYNELPLDGGCEHPDNPIFESYKENRDRPEERSYDEAYTLSEDLMPLSYDEKNNFCGKTSSNTINTESEKNDFLPSEEGKIEAGEVPDFECGSQYVKSIFETPVKNPEHKNEDQIFGSRDQLYESISGIYDRKSDNGSEDSSYESCIQFEEHSIESYDEDINKKGDNLLYEAWCQSDEGILEMNDKNSDNGSEDLSLENYRSEIESKNSISDSLKEFLKNHITNQGEPHTDFILNFLLEIFSNAEIKTILTEIIARKKIEIVRDKCTLIQNFFETLKTTDEDQWDEKFAKHKPQYKELKRQYDQLNI
ncbi:hypothetical protein CWI37_0832p0010 [Hamiltosporidium tvaerminnensis]|uniref:Uncharacterized protein n=2 Tax=Hamiltosporidium tvaerminnensis TaxID=1176355 RepID=A0A4Q9L0Y1_9MICR|nr:hypothetical protein CWI37_0832p0010 [Hamiltosporidium tvaerminnensis]